MKSGNGSLNHRGNNKEGRARSGLFAIWTCCGRPGLAGAPHRPVVGLGVQPTVPLLTHLIRRLVDKAASRGRWPGMVCRLWAHFFSLETRLYVNHTHTHTHTYIYDRLCMYMPYHAVNDEKEVY